MAELDRELLALGAYVGLPPERDLWPGIAARLGAAPRRPWLRIAAVAVAALAVAVGIAFAVPPARAAILRFLGLEGVTIVRVEKLPPATSDPSDQAMLILYGKPARLRLEETRLGVFEKLVTIRQDVEHLTVNGGRGIWVAGTHVVYEVFDQPRLSGSTLIWEQNGLTLRLEGKITKTQALRIGRSVRAD